jgi:hypothetical protein
MNDWSFRPLSKAMIKYAMDDVKYLLVCGTVRYFPGGSIIGDRVKAWELS